MKRNNLKKLILKYWEYGMNNTYLPFIKDEIKKDLDKYTVKK